MVRGEMKRIVRQPSASVAFVASLLLASSLPLALHAAEPGAAKGVPSTEQIIRNLQPGATPAYKGRGLRLVEPEKPAGEGALASPQEALAAMDFRVQFAFNSAELTPQAKIVLDRLGEALRSDQLRTYRFQVAGHTDAVGTEEANVELSKARAQAVTDYLVSKFEIAPERLVSVGYGKSQLLDPNNPASSVNRRVQIINLGKSGT
jgi:outer membrane protein OmpA-like peptidoglycan-associated protein